MKTSSKTHIHNAIKIVIGELKKKKKTRRRRGRASRARALHEALSAEQPPQQPQRLGGGSIVLNVVREQQAPQTRLFEHTDARVKHPIKQEQQAETKQKVKYEKEEDFVEPKAPRSSKKAFFNRPDPLETLSPLDRRQLFQETTPSFAGGGAGMLVGGQGIGSVPSETTPMTTISMNALKLKQFLIENRTKIPAKKDYSIEDIENLKNINHIRDLVNRTKNAMSGGGSLTPLADEKDEEEEYLF